MHSYYSILKLSQAQGRRDWRGRRETPARDQCLPAKDEAPYVHSGKQTGTASGKKKKLPCLIFIAVIEYKKCECENVLGKW